MVECYSLVESHIKPKKGPDVPARGMSSNMNTISSSALDPAGDTRCKIDTCHRTHTRCKQHLRRKDSTLPGCGDFQGDRGF